MPYNDMMQGYGPRPDYGDEFDQFRFEQIKSDFEADFMDAASQYEQATRTGNEVSKAAAKNKMLASQEKSKEFYAGQMRYLQSPSTSQNESFRPSSFESGRPASFKSRTPEVSEYENIYDDYMKKIQNDPSISQASRMGSQASKREDSLREIQSIFRSGGMSALEEYLKKQRTKM